MKEVRLNALATERGETAAQAGRRLITERLEQLADDAAWTDLSEEALTDACMAAAAQSLPAEDWSDEYGYDGGRGDETEATDGPR